MVNYIHVEKIHKATGRNNAIINGQEIRASNSQMKNSINIKNSISMVMRKIKVTEVHDQLIKLQNVEN